MPRVLNRRTAMTIPQEAVYVGRPTKWGNPYMIGADGDRDEVIRKYEKLVEDNPWMKEAAREELAGKDLICWCAPQVCHGDILLKIANEE